MHYFLPIAVAGLLLFPLLQSSAAEAPSLVSPWHSEARTRARLIAGGPAADSPSGTIAVGIEIEIAEGWKTYWRNPGSSGVPPLFDWSSSSNLASVEVRYPAPSRYSDRDGEVIGYKGHLVLPVVARPQDPGREVTLSLGLEYGVCKDICIPVQTRLELVLPPGSERHAVADALTRAFDRVPRPLNARRPSDPDLRHVQMTLDGEKPAIRFIAAFPGGAEGADLFLDPPAGLWMPLAKPEGAPQGETASFVVDLSEGADLADLKGKTVRITLVSARGQSETTLKLE
ncbi:MAG: protein-disulfide reductase DsbD domain-containing protein [Hyphomicrobiaceae bacterium]